MEIRDDRCQPWAWFDHAIIDEYAIKVGPFAVVVYMALVRFANNQDQTCYPSYDTIQARLGLSRKTVAEALQKLVAAGLVAKEQRRSGPKGRMTNIYRILRTMKTSSKELVSDVNQPNVTESLRNDAVSSLDTLTVSSHGKLTGGGQFTTETNVSSPGELTVSSPRELEQDLVKAFNKTQVEQEKDPPPISPSPTDDGEGIGSRSPVEKFVNWWSTEIVPLGGRPFSIEDADEKFIAKANKALKAKSSKRFWDRVKEGFERSRWLRGEIKPLDGKKRFRATLPWLLSGHHTKQMANYCLVAAGEWADEDATGLSIITARRCGYSGCENFVGEKSMSLCDYHAGD